MKEVVSAGGARRGLGGFTSGGRWVVRVMAGRRALGGLHHLSMSQYWFAGGLFRWRGKERLSNFRDDSVVWIDHFIEVDFGDL